MKTNLLTVSFLIALVGTSFSQQYNLVVVIKNVKEAKGRIAVALFNNEKDFTSKRLQGRIAQAKTGEVQVAFENLVPGDYAISVMHDANENDELDSNAFGIPKEGFGFSNDVMGMFGPPSFNKAKFSFTGENKITITLKYL
jgi:uncharacterized protein (DUF2141 family)